MAISVHQAQARAYIGNAGLYIFLSFRLSFFLSPHSCASPQRRAQLYLSMESLVSPRLALSQRLVVPLLLLVTLFPTQASANLITFTTFKGWTIALIIIGAYLLKAEEESNTRG